MKYFILACLLFASALAQTGEAPARRALLAEPCPDGTWGPSGTTLMGCAPCGSCPSGKVLTAECTSTSPIQCATICSSGTWSATGDDRDGACTPCSTCSGSETESAACTTTSDTVCVPIFFTKRVYDNAECSGEPTTTTTTDIPFPTLDVCEYAGMARLTECAAPGFIQSKAYFSSDCTGEPVDTQEIRHGECFEEMEEYLMYTWEGTTCDPVDPSTLYTIEVESGRLFCQRNRRLARKLGDLGRPRSVPQCGQLCYDEPKCGAFTYHEKSGKCSGFTDIGTPQQAANDALTFTIGRMKRSAVIPYNIVSYSSGLRCHQDEIIGEWDSFGRKMFIMACANKCHDHGDECTAFVFNENSGFCTGFKSCVAAAAEMIPDKVYTIGIMAGRL